MTINNNNYETVEIPSNITKVNIEGTITLQADYERFEDIKNITFIGGKIVGNGGRPHTSYSFDVGDQTTFYGTEFDNIVIRGDDFVSVENSPKITNGFSLMYDENTTIKDSYIIGATVEEFENIEYSVVTDSTLLRGGYISNSDIRKSTIGSSSTGRENVSMITNNSFISETLIYLNGNNQTFSNNNDVDECFIKLYAGGQKIITNNNFDGPYNGKNEIISIDTSTTSWNMSDISNNNFVVKKKRNKSSTPQTIKISGSSRTTGLSRSGSSYTTIKNNNFLGGNSAITYSGDDRVVVIGNIVRNTNLGVTTNRLNLYVQGNMHLD
jgi:hypothetical protein